MTTLLAILIGFLFSVSIYLLLRRSIVKLVLGLLFLSYATSLLLFVTGGLTVGKPAFVESQTQIASKVVSDPLPQALILTAIVIGFGVAAFAMVLIYRFHRETGTIDMDELSETNQK